MYYDRFDIVSAHYVYCCDYYAGQGCPLYARLCKIGEYFKPGKTWKGYESLSDNGKYIYDNLANKRIQP